MPLLSHTQPDGTQFDFDSMTGKWTARRDGHKPSSSQSLATLTERVEKWAEPAGGKKAADAQVELVTVGLAGVKRSHSMSSSGFYGAPDLPPMGVRVVNAKLAWKDGQVAMVRYQEGGSASKEAWQSASQPCHFLNPATFTAEDRSVWEAVAMAQTAAAMFKQGQVKLAEAWDRLNPVDSVVHRMDVTRDPSSRQISGCRLEAVAICPAYENRDYVAISPRWPVIDTLAPKTALDPAEFTGWESDDGRLRHPSGVEVSLSEVGSMSPTFQVSRPDPAGGPRQVLFEGSMFAEAFRLGRATVALADRQAVPVTEWRAHREWLSHGVMWPSLVQTEGLAIFAISEQFRSTDLLTPFVLQSGEEEQAEKRVWRRVMREPHATYRPESPADVLLEQRATLAAAFEAVIASLRATLQLIPARLDAMHAAALQSAYATAQEEETPETAEVAQARLAHYFKRVQSQASQQVAASGLAMTVKNLVLDAPTPPTPAATGRRSAPR